MTIADDQYLMIVGSNCDTILEYSLFDYLHLSSNFLGNLVLSIPFPRMTLVYSQCLCGGSDHHILYHYHQSLRNKTVFSG